MTKGADRPVRTLRRRRLPVEVDVTRLLGEDLGHDLGTMRAIASEDRADHFVPSYVDLLTQQDLVVTDDSIGQARDYWLAGTGLEGWQQVQYVPVQFRVLQSDGSFSPARRTTWGYVFARNGDDERWRLVDQGVG